MRFTFFCLLFISICCHALYAQQDTTAGIKGSVTPPNLQPDSVAQTNREQFLADSFAMIWLKPDSLRENQFLAQMAKNKLPDIWSLAGIHTKPNGFLKTGEVRNSRDPWVIMVIIALLIYTAFLNLFLGSDVNRVIQSFYDKHVLLQVDKEGGVINSWAFIGLFILFSLASGLVLYQVIIYYDVYYNMDGFHLFLSLSLLTSSLFVVKFLVLKLIGFIFDINRPVSQYIAILNMTYFNIAFVFLAVTICFSLLSRQFIPFLLVFTGVLIAIIFAWQFLRNSVNIISDFRFHKFYLFIYLCALEICPVLILIKALDI
jgi:hypothetical protein